MDFLAKELERKKKALEAAKQQQQEVEPGKGKGGRFFRASELQERMQQVEQQEQENNDTSKNKTIDYYKNVGNNNDNDDKKKKKKTNNSSAQEEDNAIEEIQKEQESRKRKKKKKKNKQEREERKKRKKEKQQLQQQQQETSNNDDAETKDESNNIDAPNMIETADSTAEEQQQHSINEQELTQQLRQFGLPVRYFGETNTERQLRLQKALEEQQSRLKTLTEKDEFRLNSGHGIRNTFLNTKRGAGAGNNADEEELLLIEQQQQQQLEQQKKKQKKRQEEKDDNNNDNDNDDNNNEQDDDDDDDDDDNNNDDDNNEDTTNDPHKEIYKYFKGLLKQWEYELSQRPLHIQSSTKGKQDMKTYKQCKDYIRPLFKLCKSRQLQETSSMIRNLSTIVACCKSGEFIQANDAYMDIAIGRAAWPIGVTMVGIHARTGRSKIESSNVAHVMNSELQRKYLTSVKRLITFAQSQAQHVNPSKKVY